MLTYCAGVPVEGLPKRARLMIGLGLGVIGTLRPYVNGSMVSASLHLLQIRNSYRMNPRSFRISPLHHSRHISTHSTDVTQHRRQAHQIPAAQLKIIADQFFVIFKIFRYGTRRSFEIALMQVCLFMGWVCPKGEF